MTHARTLRHAAAFAFLGLITLPVACGSDDDEKASPSTGGTGGSDAGGTGGTGGSGATDAGDAACTFGEPQVKTCNLLDNDCPCGAKCSLLLTSESPPKVERACVALKGTKAKGEECTREEVGIDDCGPGLMCFRDGPDAVRKCQPLCEKTSDCGANASCVSLVPPDPSPDSVLSGGCWAKCDPFNVAANCPAGSKCLPVPMVEGKASLFCYSGPGTTPEGTPCANAPEQCAPGLACLKSSWESVHRCWPYCDMSHACPSGLSCAAIPEADFMGCLPLPPDAGTDAGTDAASDAGTDAATDASLD